MRVLLFLAIALITDRLAPAQSPEPNDLHRITNRISEDAENFRKVAPLVLSEETLEQRSLSPGAPRGRAARKSPTQRRIVSEYGYADLRSAPGALHEFRKVLQVDGREISSLAEGRQSMASDLVSLDDKQKKRLLDDFEKQGLKGAVTDFGQLLLLFSKRRIRDYDFQIVKQTRVGVEPVLVLSYQQVHGPESLTVSHDRASARQPLAGEIWVRQSDSLPLRITLISVQHIKESTIRDEAAVDYSPSPIGSVLPASVVHREYLNNNLVSENVFRYAPFRRMPGGAGQTAGGPPGLSNATRQARKPADGFPVVKAPVVQLPQ